MEFVSVVFFGRLLDSKQSSGSFWDILTKSLTVQEFHFLPHGYSFLTKRGQLCHLALQSGSDFDITLNQVLQSDETWVVVAPEGIMEYPFVLCVC